MLCTVAVLLAVVAHHPVPDSASPAGHHRPGRKDAEVEESKHLGDQLEILGQEVLDLSAVEALHRGRCIRGHKALVEVAVRMCYRLDMMAETVRLVPEPTVAPC